MVCQGTHAKGKYVRYNFWAQLEGKNGVSTSLTAALSSTTSKLLEVAHTRELTKYTFGVAWTALTLRGQLWWASRWASRGGRHAVVHYVVGRHNIFTAHCAHDHAHDTRKDTVTREVAQRQCRLATVQWIDAG